MTTLGDSKKKTLALIEELNPESEYLTDDPDISAKINFVFNQVMFELARIKKLPKYVVKPVSEGDMVTFDDIKQLCGKTVYQLGTVCGVDHVFKANGTIIKVLESGNLEVDCFVYPEKIVADTPDSYEFELSEDVLEIMPYGVAADLLKSDISTEYGSIYATRYETMLQRLDPRNNVASIYIEGGVAL